MNTILSREGTISVDLWHALRLSGTSIGTPGALEVVYSLSWFIRQQPKILNRFDPAQNDLHTLEGLGPDSYWAQKLPMYLSRAAILGFYSPQGRQSVAEYAATAMGLLASVWRLYGPPASIDQNFRDGVTGIDANRKP